MFFVNRRLSQSCRKPRQFLLLALLTSKCSGMKFHATILLRKSYNFPQSDRSLFGCSLRNQTISPNPRVTAVRLLVRNAVRRCHARCAFAALAVIVWAKVRPNTPRRCAFRMRMLRARKSRVPFLFLTRRRLLNRPPVSRTDDDGGLAE